MQLYIFKAFNERYDQKVNRFFVRRTVALLASFRLGVAFGLNAWIAFVVYAIACLALHLAAVWNLFFTEPISLRRVEAVIASVGLLLALVLWTMAAVIAQGQELGPTAWRFKQVVLLLALAKLCTMHIEFLVAAALQRAFPSASALKQR